MRGKMSENGTIRVVMEEWRKLKVFLEKITRVDKGYPLRSNKLKSDFQNHNVKTCPYC